MKLAIIGAGWAGLAAAVQATHDGHRVTVFESARTLGGRARTVPGQLPDGRTVPLDNGQHILIGAYTETLRLMRTVGIDPEAVLHRQPLCLQFPDGSGLRLPRLPAPWDAFIGILRTRTWPLSARLGLLRTARQWQSARFQCPPALTVAQLCQHLAPCVREALIDPLCVSALNTPAPQASAQVFLRVLQDALFSVPGGSHLLLPRCDLSALFPVAAAAWLQQHGATVHMGHRITTLQTDGMRWHVQDQPFDAVLLACRLVEGLAGTAGLAGAARWSATTSALRFEAITTVYGWHPQARLSAPMLALRHAASAPAQFIFDRGQLGGPSGLLALVISASGSEREQLQDLALAQAQTQFGWPLQAVLTVVEKRATFACTPGLQRPPITITPTLLACGDYVAGPYPATLEGAVRSGLQAVANLPQTDR